MASNQSVYKYIDVFCKKHLDLDRVDLHFFVATGHQRLSMSPCCGPLAIFCAVVLQGDRTEFVS